MICQKCHKNVATIHFTEIINGKSTNVYLCEECANLNSKINNGIGLDEILASLMGFTQPKLQYANKKEELICPKCKLTYREFKKIGKLGCEKCYEVFADKLEPIIQQLHGNTVYKGKRPNEKLDDIKEDSKLQELKQRLQEKIKNEEYEEAAKIRDMIKEIENKK